MIHPTPPSAGGLVMPKNKTTTSTRRESGEFVASTFIDSHTQIPEDLYRRLEADASVDRGAASIYLPRQCYRQKTCFICAIVIPVPGCVCM